MSIKSHGSKPVVDPSTFLAMNAVPMGNIRAEAYARITYGAVLNSKNSSVEFGPKSVVHENPSWGRRQREDCPVVVGVTRSKGCINKRLRLAIVGAGEDVKEKARRKLGRS